MAQSFLLPVIYYADSAFLDTTVELTNKLDRIQNACIRFVYGLKKFDHVSPFRSELEWLSFGLSRDYHILCLLFNVLRNSSPRYLYNRLQSVPSYVLQLRSGDGHLLLFPTHHTNFYTNSFTIHSVRIWNALPTEIRSSSTYNNFKLLLKRYLLRTLFHPDLSS